MKKILILVALLCCVTILRTSVITSVHAQYNNLRVNPEDIKFDFASKIVCILFKSCTVKDDGTVVIPTPDPNSPTPTDAPYPSGIPFPTLNPSITPPPGTCMPPGGRISCGSKNTPLPPGPNGCGHCGKNYGNPSYCRTSNSTDISSGGQSQAIDISHSPLDSVPLPFLLGHNIIWHHSSEKNYKDDPAYYQDYTGTDTVVKKKYILRFLHTQRGSGTPVNSEASSGNEGAKVCSSWLKYVDKCDKYKVCSCNSTRGCTAIVPGNHIHIQIYDSNVRQWVDAANYYCH